MSLVLREEKTLIMMTVILTFVLIAVIMLAMAIGVMVSGRRLRGSCGGAGAGCHCRAEGISPEFCDRDREIEARIEAETQG